MFTNGNSSESETNSNSKAKKNHKKSTNLPLSFKISKNKWTKKNKTLKLFKAIFCNPKEIMSIYLKSMKKKEENIKWGSMKFSADSIKLSWVFNKKISNWEIETMKRVSSFKNLKNNSPFYRKKELYMHQKAGPTTNPKPMLEFHPQVKKTVKYLPYQHLSKFNMLLKLINPKKQTTIKITLKSYNQCYWNTKKSLKTIRKQFHNSNKEFMST